VDSGCISGEVRIALGFKVRAHLARVSFIGGIDAGRNREIARCEEVLRNPRPTAEIQPIADPKQMTLGMETQVLIS
jgi:hypothetical protein